MKDAEHGVKLDLLKELMGMRRSALKDKLPKKGISIMSVSMSKPKGPETTEDVHEKEPEAPLGDELPDSELPESPEAEQELPSEEEAPEHEADESESEENMEHELPEPKIPADIMEIVKLLLARKGKGDHELS